MNVAISVRHACGSIGCTDEWTDDELHAKQQMQLQATEHQLNLSLAALHIYMFFYYVTFDSSHHHGFKIHCRD